MECIRLRNTVAQVAHSEIDSHVHFFVAKVKIDSLLLSIVCDIFFKP